MEDALESGAEDFAREGDRLHRLDHRADVPRSCRMRSSRAATRSRASELAQVPSNTVKVEGEDASRVLKLVDLLEELDDVSKVFSNFDIDASQLAEAET